MPRLHAWSTSCSRLIGLEQESKQVKAFLYAQSGSDADRENILSLEKSYFQLTQNSAKKQTTMYDFFVKK
jgi:hypothetical protein